MAISGGEAQLTFSDQSCVPIEVVLDWEEAGDRCPTAEWDSFRTCDTYHGSCALSEAFGYDCNGCQCNSDGNKNFFVIHQAGAVGSTAITTSESCAATCYGQTCDSWNGQSCGELQSFFGCDCSGCDCESCEDTSGNATDEHSGDCSIYSERPGYCGGYDDSDFSSNAMCCACGGGLGDSSGGQSLVDDLSEFWDSAANDFDGVSMQGKPFAASLKK